MIRKAYSKYFIVIVLLFSIIALTSCDDNVADNTQQSKEETERLDDSTNKDDNSQENEDTSEEDDSFVDLSIGKKLPNFELPNLEGEMISLESQRGKKVLLNIWTTT